MIITAITKFTAIDFPGRLACVIFTGGCNFRCGFCHNAEFVLPERLAQLKTPIPFEVILNFLQDRVGLLDGVSVCGGEPTMHHDLPERLKEIKNLGFQVKLDTNGTNPQMLEQLIKDKLVDYYAMDIKDAFPYRHELVGVYAPEEKIRKSISLIMDSGFEYEFRSTILPNFHDVKTLQQMGEAIRGADKWVLQGFRNTKTLSDEFRTEESFDENSLDQLTNYLSEYAKKVEYRPG